MVGKQLLIRKGRLRCPITKIQCTIGLIVFHAIILFVFHDQLRFEWIFENSSLISTSESMVSSRSATNLLFLYKEELSSVEKSSFQPTFHNHHLKFKLNLTTMAKDLVNSFKNNSKKQIHQLTIITLRSLKDVNDFHPMCEISLSFDVQILNLEEIHLIYLLQKTNCSLTLMNTSEIISVNIHGTFLVDDRFRFTCEWSDFNKSELVFWSQWPIPIRCLNIRNKSEKEVSKLISRCSRTSVLVHSTSRELFLEEQNALSNWLDLQYKASIDQRYSEEKENRRRLTPFEIAKNNKVCSNEFQNWIWKYQQWHENISFLINNGSMTFKEQRNRIIELDIRFLIYEKARGGIADRIIHLISTYLVALLTNRFLIFEANWPEFFDVMQSSLNYEQKLLIPWFSQFQTLNQNLSVNDKYFLTFKWCYFSFDRYTKDYNYDKTKFPQRILVFHAHTGGVIHTMQSNTSIYKQFLTNDLQMNTDQIFGCLYHSLFTYRLNQLIKRVELTSANDQIGHSPEQILQILLSTKYYPIGIQIRAGDKTLIETYINQSNLILHDKKNLDPFSNFFTCAQDIIYKKELFFQKNAQKGITFLLSDSLQIRQSALRHWKLPLKCFQSFEKECQSDNEHFYILANSNPVFHVEHTKNPKLAFQLAMFDIFLFSLCEVHIISTESGFGRFPAFASLKQRNIYSFLLNEQHSCRDEGLTLAVSGYHWSGI